MKLVVLKRSAGDPLPVGATFEIPDEDRASAETLILAGLAKEYVEEPETEPTTRRGRYQRRDLRAEE